MTAFDRFDPFAGRVSAALEEIAPATRPSYLDAILAETARTGQRPRWSFPGRWIPATLIDAVPPSIRRTPTRAAGLLLLALLLLLLAAVVWVGARNRVPPPFGPARNGHIAYAENGDIYSRDDLGKPGTLLIGGPGDQRYPAFSPDGTLLFYSVTTDDEILMVANADGSNPRVVDPEPLIDAVAVWGPDSRTIAVITTVRSFPTLQLVHADGSAPTRLLGVGDDLVPIDVQWRPPDGQELLVRGHEGDGTIDLYRLALDGTVLGRLHLPSPLEFGVQWELTGSVFSPDGQHIAYNRVEDDPNVPYTHFRIHVVAIDGTGDVALPPPSDPMVHEAWPQYSPDGKTLLVHDWTWSWEGNQGWIGVMPPDGSAPSRRIGPVISGGEHTGLTKGWSPDGTRVFMRTDNTTQVFSIDPTTGVEEAIDWTQDLPDWQRTATH